MNANLEIMRMKKEIIETINTHNMPIAVTTLVLKEVLSEAQTQLDIALSNAIAKEKEEAKAEASSEPE